MTSQTVTDELLPVTQADREAAAALVQWHNNAASEWKTDGGSDLQFFTSDMPDQIRRGVWDNHDVVQAFARHRTSHSLPGDVGMQLVPVKPTEAMYLAAFESSPWDGSGPIRRVVDEVWAAMLRAALSSPLSGDAASTGGGVEPSAAPCSVCGAGLTTQIGASMKAKAEGAAGWMRRAAAAEIAVIQAREALQKIVTGRIDGEPNNARDTLGVVREIAANALATLSPDQGGADVLREALELARSIIGNMIRHGFAYIVEADEKMPIPQPNAFYIGPGVLPKIDAALSSTPAQGEGK